MDVQLIEPQRAPLLVDFEGGTLTYKRGGAPAAKNEDGSPVEGARATPATEVRQTGVATELLLLTPDGKLLGRDSALDAPDEEREKRVKDFENRVLEAEGKEAPATPGKPGSSDPFKP